jgi:hypothetical protein
MSQERSRGRNRDGIIPHQGRPAGSSLRCLARKNRLVASPQSRSLALS